MLRSAQHDKLSPVLLVKNHHRAQCEAVEHMSHPEFLGNLFSI